MLLPDWAVLGHVRVLVAIKNTEGEWVLRSDAHHQHGISPGTFYGRCDELVDRGLVELRPATDTSLRGDPSEARLTDAGRRFCQSLADVLEAEHPTPEAENE